MTLFIVAALAFVPSLLLAQPQRPPTGPSGGGELPSDSVRVADTFPRPLRWGFGLSAALREHVRADSAWLVALLDSLENTDSARMRRNLALAPAAYMPTRLERARRELEIWRSMGLHEAHPNAYVPLVTGNLNTVFMALGLTEDVTPRIRYRLERTSHVTVRVYNLEAQIVATLVNGSSPPGEYDFEWDFLNDDGRRVPYGSYIADVIVDKVLVLRKRILVP